MLQPEKVKQIHAERWSRTARDYQQTVVPIFAPVVDEILRRASLRPGETVLDIGTGPGVAAFRAARRVGPAGRVTGIDLAPDMIALAEDQAKRDSLTNVTFSVMDAETLSFTPESFDAVISSLSLMLCPDPARVLAEAFRVLRPGGRIAIAVWGDVDRTAMGRLRRLAEDYVAAPPGMTDANTLGDRDLVDRLFLGAGFAGTVEAVTIELTYRDVEHFWMAHGGAIQARLQPDQIAAIHDRIVAEFGPAAPLTLANEAIFAAGHRP